MRRLALLVDRLAEALRRGLELRDRRLERVVRGVRVGEQLLDLVAGRLDPCVSAHDLACNQPMIQRLSNRADEPLERQSLGWISRGRCA